MNRFLNVLILLLMTIFVVVFFNRVGPKLGWTWPLWSSPKIELPAPPTPTAENIVASSATQVAEAGVIIPTIEYRYIETQDIEGLINYLKTQEEDWSTLSHNFHAMEVTGVGTSYQRLESNACDWVGETQNPLCAWHEVGYISVYKGVMTGGTQNLFTNMEISIDPNSYTVTQTEKNGIITIIKTPDVSITLSTTACITNIEETTPSPINYTDSVPKTSYTLKTVDQKHLWVSDGSDINEEYLRLTAEKQAKVMALHQDSTNTVMQLVASEASYGGTIYQFVEEVFSPKLAKQFGFNSIEFKIIVNPGSDTLRCDGTPIIK